MRSMGLQYPGDWKFDGIGFGVPAQVVSELTELMVKIADGSQSVIEDFKRAYGSPNTSTSYSWAVSDLVLIVDESADNAAVFIDNLWKGIEQAKTAGLQVPSPKFINEILANNEIPLRIDPPHLHCVSDSAIVDARTASDVVSTGPVAAFLLGEKIGEGGYGVVHKATRSTAVADFTYAIKILDPSPFVEDYHKALRRFKREVKALQSLQHRAIIPYFEAGLTVDNKPYIVMPLVQGLNLRAATAGKSLDEIARLFVEILSALQYAHEHDVLHRDLKPSNILVRTVDCQPIILDFGSSYLLDQMDSEALTTQAVGTIGYIPSEVISDPKTRSPLQDVYACGVMLYEALARKRPDPANYAPLVNMSEELRAFDPIVEGAISGSATRTPSASAVAEQLTEYLRHGVAVETQHQ